MGPFLSYHIRLPVLIFAAIPIGSAILLQIITQHSPLTPFFRSFAGVVGPFFVSVAILFGLFATFLAADVWERVNDSNHSLEQEVGAIRTIRQISASLGEHGQAINLAIIEYTEVTLRQEWDNRESQMSQAADMALGRLVQTILTPEMATNERVAAQDALLTSFHEIRQARATRTHIASSSSDKYKWATVLLLGILTQVALVACHIVDRKAQSAALAIFTSAFVVTVIALGVHEQPLADPMLVSMQNMERLRE